MAEQEPRKLSTSALAKSLDIPAQQLFSTLKDYGWIRKVEDGWVLTGKGEFEGGEYVHSKRYGRYIVWPPELADHPLLKALEDNRHLSATALGKPYQLSAREVNRILCELGWIHHEMQGWELTVLGKENGGVVIENENSGTFYVVWPQAVSNDLVLTEQLQLAASLFNEAAPASGDLFGESDRYVTVDGREHDSRLKAQVGHWLYLAGFAFATHRQLPVTEKEILYADFYLPQQHIYIECWDEAGGDLAKRMRRKELYQHYGFAAIDIEAGDAEQLDEVLTRELRKLGVRVF